MPNDPTDTSVIDFIEKVMTVQREAMPWRRRGACRGMGPVFHPRPTRRYKSEEAAYEAVKPVCQGCPVRLTCLRWSLDNAEPLGIWGGVPEQARKEAIQMGKKAEELLKEWA